MATKIRELPTTAPAVTDIDGIGVQGSDSAQNIRPAFQGTGALLGRMNAGTDALDDTVTYCDPDDNTKLFRTDAGDIPSGATRILNAEKMFRAAPLETVYTSSGTHTFRTSTTYFQIEAVGGGGGGGGADGQGAGKRAAAAGGCSGFYGKTAILAKGSILTGAVTIGAAGTAGAAAGGNGGSGGNTTWVDLINSFLWGFGRGGNGVTGTNDSSAVAPPNLPSGYSAGIYGSSSRNTMGAVILDTSGSPTPDAYGGIGGASPFGNGGGGGHASAGGDAEGYGAGGGGAASKEVTTNFAGGAGSPGLLIVREW